MIANKINGSIINVSSQMGHVGAINRTTYCTTKFAIEGFTKASSLELAKYGIRVNSICPTFIKTPMTDKLSEDQQNQILKNIPASRFGLPSDVASACIYLSSDEASFVTGSTIHVNGGMGMF